MELTGQAGGKDPQTYLIQLPVDKAIDACHQVSTIVVIAC